MLRRALEILVMPPFCLFLIGGLGVALMKRRPRLGRWLAGGAAGVLFVLCVPYVAAALLIGLQTEGPVDLDAASRAQAIVILGGDLNPGAPEYGGATVGTLSLERVRYGGRLARATGLPVLVTGGSLRDGTPPVARLMKEVLEEELGVSVRWSEERAGNTRENASYSAQLLRAAGVSRVLLVTHAWHMPRSLQVFERVGLEIVPAPTGFRIWPDFKPRSFVPSARSLRQSTWAIHEWLGRVWYGLTGK